MTKWMVVALWLCVGMLSLSAQQAPTGEAAESQLGFYLGKWTEEGQSRAKPTGAFGKITGEESCAWFSGGPSVVCRETTQDQSGETDSIYILAFDASRKLYTVYGTDNVGTVYSGTGTVDQGGVWHWTAEARAKGVVTPMRYTFRSAGNGSRTMDVEVAASKGVWAKIVGVTYKRAR